MVSSPEKQELNTPGPGFRMSQVKQIMKIIQVQKIFQEVPSNLEVGMELAQHRVHMVVVRLKTIVQDMVQIRVADVVILSLHDGMTAPRRRALIKWVEMITPLLFEGDAAIQVQIVTVVIQII